MNELDTARKIINETDDKIAQLFCKRMEAVKVVAQYKQKNGLPVYDKKREDEILLRSSDRVEDAVLRSYYVSFLSDTMKISREYQRSLLSGMRVAYCGTEGAFAHIVANLIFPDEQKVPFGSFFDAYSSVVNGDCDCVVLPVENSFAGDVGQVMDLLFSGSLYVNGMYDLAVTHDLLGVPGSRLEDVRTVVSHPQALSQCDSFIKEHELAKVQYSNTALAAQYVAETGDRTVAAIGSAQSAPLFGLEILSRRINDSSSNTTHFAVLSRVNEKRDNNTHFSLVFTVKNEAGALAQAINIIGRHGFNMRTLRSRPMKELMWKYYFYVEAEGDIYGYDGRQCFEELKSCCDRLKIVGTYRMIENQEETEQ